MTIRNNNNNDNNSKSFASVPTEEEIYDAVAFNVNVDVSNEDNIPFAHATSIDFSSSGGGGSTPTAANSGYGQLNTTSSATTIMLLRPPLPILLKIHHNRQPSNQHSRDYHQHLSLLRQVHQHQRQHLRLKLLSLLLLLLIIEVVDEIITQNIVQVGLVAELLVLYYYVYSFYTIDDIYLENYSNSLYGNRR